MSSDVEYVNSALIRLGSKIINDFSTSGDLGTAANLAYKSVRRMCLTMHPWRFATTKKQLGLLVTAPANEWTYAHQLPSDMITGPWAVFNTTDVDCKPVTDGWERFGDKIFSDYDTLVIDYRVDVADGSFPWWFQELIILALCAALGPTVTSDQGSGLTAHYHGLAFGPPSDNMEGGYFAKCKKIDGYGNPTTSIGSTEITDTRFS